MIENGKDTKRLIARGRDWPNCDTDAAVMRAILVLTMLLLVALIFRVLSGPVQS